MVENEKIKTVKLGDKKGCLFEDLIQIQISPDWLENIRDVFREKAMNSGDYFSQGFKREKADFFDEALETWKKARSELDN